MSEDFDELLSGAVDSAANAAHKPGASVARERGRQRRTRRRLAASTLAIVLLGGAGSVAAVSLGHNSRTPTVSVTGTPTPSPSPTGSASTSPSPSLSPSPSGSPSLTQSSNLGGSASTGTSTSSGTTASTSPPPATETWLSPSQVPLDSAMNWTTGTTVDCTGSLVFEAFYPGGCSEHTTDPGSPHPATEMDTRFFSSSGVPTTVATAGGEWIPSAAGAVQTFYTYPNAADAQSAYQYFTQQIRGEDSQVGGNANTGFPLVSTTTVTAQTDDGLAIDHTFRDSHGTPVEVDGNASGYSDFHFFFVVKDDLLDVIQINGGPGISNTSQDGSSLATIESTLG
jgi:hypothetical protein